MNTNEREQVAKDIFQKCLKLMEGKGKEYSGNVDILSNFKRNADNLGLTKYQVLMIYMAKHFDSVLSEIKKHPEFPTDASEPFESRITDLINYLILLQCLRLESMIPAGAVIPVKSVKDNIYLQQIKELANE